MVNGLLLALGMLTALPVPAVREVSPAAARAAMLWAPVAALPLAVLAGAAMWTGDRVGLAPLATGFLTVGLLALGSRALHLDGLSDVADALTASYDRERSLEVMKGGTAGPAGVAALVIVLGAQAAGVAGLLAVAERSIEAALLAAGAVCVSRAALWVTACRVVPAARPDGLGSTFTRTVPLTFAVLGWVVLAAAAAALDPVIGPVTVLLTAVAVVALTRRAIARFGGVTGDVFGAAIELGLLVLLLGAGVAIG